MSIAPLHKGTMRRMRSPRTKHVVVALRLAGIAGQDKLNGIFEYLSEGPRWNLAIYRTLHEFSAETVRKEIARGATGFIVGLPGAEDAFRALADTSLPTVLMNVESAAFAARSDILTVKSDAEAVGRTAANTLLQQGVYKSYGYVGYPTDDDWSRERGRSFRDTLEKAGFIARMFDSTHFRDQTESKSALRVWLRTLPKPCGLLAACDDRAYEVIGVCRDAGLEIPKDIGLLGVNNDPILCENAEPTISSVQPDFKREGRVAAQLLDRAMAHTRARRPPTDGVVLVGVRQVVLRGSTVPLSHTGKMIQRALAFIERNATRKVSVPDVARHLKVSRSLLDLRFRELQRETVHDAIVRIRLDEVKRRLRATGDTIDQVTAACGWENPNTLKALFRRRFGLSMTAWREENP